MAEDREDDALMLQRAFRQLGLNTPVQYVTDGEQAIAYLTGHGAFSQREEYPLPDLLLLDLKMPRKDGFDVLNWIQTVPLLCRLRTVVLTTSEDSFEINRAYQLGAASFLTKPVSLNEFVEIVKAVTGYWLGTNRSPLIERPR